MANDIYGNGDSRYLATDPINNPGKGSLGAMLGRAITKIQSLGNPGPTEGVWNFGPIAKGFSEWDNKQRYGTDPVVAPAATLGTVPTPAALPPAQVADAGLPTKASAKVKKVAAPQEVISQPDEAGLQTPEDIAASKLGDDSLGLKNANIVGNGGFAQQDGKTYLLPKRTDSEDAAMQQTLAQAPATPSYPATPQTSTIGYGHGVYNLAVGQNAPPDYGSMNESQMLGAKFAMGMQSKQATIDNLQNTHTAAMLGHQITGQHYNNTDALAASLAPSQSAQNFGSAYHSTVTADNIKALQPGAIKIQDSTLGLNTAHGNYYNKLGEAMPTKAEIAASNQESKMALLIQNQQKIGADAYSKHLLANPGDEAGANIVADTAMARVRGDEVVLGAPAAEESGSLWWKKPAVAAIGNSFIPKGTNAAAAAEYKKARIAAKGDPAKIAAIDARFATIVGGK